MAKGSCSTPCLVAKVLILVGALNWGLIGLGYFLKTDLNVVNMLLGTWPTIEFLLYLLVGVSAVAALVWKGKCDGCKV